MSKKFYVLLALIACCFATTASAQRFALKTNALYWAAATPNLGAELALSDHSTLNLTLQYNPFTIGTDNKIQHFLCKPEYRYWFSEKFTRLYIGAHVFGGTFEVGGFNLPFGLLKRLQNNYYKGNAFGAGVSIGYNFYISPHFNIETSVGIGLARLSYHTEPVNGTPQRHYKNTHKVLPVPTEIGVSFVYLFNSRR